MSASSLAALLEDMEEAIASGDRATARAKAEKVVAADGDNVDGLWALLNCSLPDLRRDGQFRVDPTLQEAAKGWALAKRIVALDPDHMSAWIRGAILATQHLGLSEEVLVWWEDYRTHHPRDPVPLIEQAALLIRLGHYADASARLELLFEKGMDEMPRTQVFRVERMHRTVKRFYEMEKIDVFRPQNPDHAGWKDIDSMRNLKPSSEKFTFFMLAGPLIIWEIFALKMFMPADPSMLSMVFAFILIYASILLVKKMSLSMTDKRNRPVLDLWRAIEIEATSGQTCVPEKIREAKLYRTVMVKDYPVAFRERIERIVEKGDVISKRWELRLPTWAVHDLSEEE